MSPMRCLALLVLFVLAGCRSTLLENLPAGATDACPQALRGAWIALDSDTRDAEDAGFVVALDCALTLVEWHDGQWRETRFEPRHARSRGDALVFFSAREAAPVLELEPVPEGWYPFEWRRNDDRLVLRQPDHRRIATLIVNGAIEGRTTWSRDEGHNVVLGDGAAIAAALQGAFAFDDEGALHARRVGEDRRALDRALARAGRKSVGAEGPSHKGRRPRERERER